MGGVTVTRIGTQVVVRFRGVVDDSCRSELEAACQEVAALALRRVVVDFDGAEVQRAGVDFVAELASRWQVRVLHPTREVRELLAAHPHGPPAPAARAGPPFQPAGGVLASSARSSAMSSAGEEWVSPPTER